MVDNRAGRVYKGGQDWIVMEYRTMDNSTIFDARADLIADLARIQSEIDDDCRAYESDDEPGVQVTVACNDDATEYALQTGDNSFTGAAYSFPHWAVDAVYRNSDIEELADELYSQLRELLPDSDEE